MHTCWLPVMLSKTMKNCLEAAGMRQAHWYNGTIFCQFGLSLLHPHCSCPDGNLTLMCWHAGFWQPGTLSLATCQAKGVFCTGLTGTLWLSCCQLWWVLFGPSQKGIALGSASSYAAAWKHRPCSIISFAEHNTNRQWQEAVSIVPQTAGAQWGQPLQSVYTLAPATCCCWLSLVKKSAERMLCILQVSLTSSLDRECGASLYVVLFAVLLDMCKWTATGKQGGVLITSQSANPLR